MRGLSVTNAVTFEVWGLATPTWWDAKGGRANNPVLVPEKRADGHRPITARRLDRDDVAGRLAELGVLIARNERPSPDWLEEVRDLAASWGTIHIGPATPELPSLSPTVPYPDLMGDWMLLALTAHSVVEALSWIELEPNIRELRLQLEDRIQQQARGELAGILDHASGRSRVGLGSPWLSLLRLANAAKGPAPFRQELAGWLADRLNATPQAFDVLQLLPLRIVGGPSVAALTQLYSRVVRGATPKVCPGCGRHFLPRQKDQVYCRTDTSRCRVMAHRKRSQLTAN